MRGIQQVMMRGIQQVILSITLSLSLGFVFLGVSLAKLPESRAINDAAAPDWIPPSNSLHRGGNLPTSSSARPVNLSIEATTPPTLPVNVLITPTNGLTLSNPWPVFDWLDAIDAESGPLTYTLLITGSGAFKVWGQAATATVNINQSHYTATQPLANDVYQWTILAEDTEGNQSGHAAPATFVVSAGLLFPTMPLISPANGSTVTTPGPTFDWLDASQPQAGMVTYTLNLTSSGVATNVLGQGVTATVILTQSIYSPTQSLPDDVYSWTVQAADAAGRRTDAGQARFVVQTRIASYLPVVMKNASNAICPTASINTFELIPIEGPAADRPGPLHADLNLALRGYATTNSFLGLIDVGGGLDGNAPQLAGIFSPRRLPEFKTVYQVNDWDWGCGNNGCPQGPITNPEVTMAGFTTTPGETIYIPSRNPTIFGGDYKAMVLYAEERRITLGYTRMDSVVIGYSAHLENICVDPNLLALYQAQVDSSGWHVTGQLPALHNEQLLGTALGTEIQAVIRDNGVFMEPRSRKDWWQNF